MLARPLVARPLVAAAVLLTAGAASVLVVGGTSAADGPVVLRPAVAPRVYGPVTARPVLGPRVYGPPAWLPAPGPLGALGPPAAQLPPVITAPPGPPLGPPLVPPAMGPPGVFGPDSPLHQVRAVQRLLNRAGARLRVDGAWGPATTRAVSAVQARAHLPVDGRVGPRTLTVLRAQS